MQAKNITMSSDALVSLYGVFGTTGLDKFCSTVPEDGVLDELFSDCDRDPMKFLYLLWLARCCVQTDENAERLERIRAFVRDSLHVAEDGEEDGPAVANVVVSGPAYDEICEAFDGQELGENVEPVVPGTRELDAFFFRNAAEDPGRTLYLAWVDEETLSTREEDAEPLRRIRRYLKDHMAVAST